MNETNISKRIAEYRMVNERLKALDKEATEKAAPWLEMKNLLSGVILKHLEDTGCSSVRADTGTAIRSETQTASLEDPEAFMNHVKSTGAFELLDRKANVTAVAAYVETNNELPPGVKLNPRLTLSVRAPAKKKDTPAQRAIENPDGVAAQVTTQQVMEE